jgi:hypothetical protein
MPAAKHEVPGKGELLAEAPGFGLVNPRTGSICWQVLLGDKKCTIMRRDIADKFLGIFSWHEDVETAYAFAKEQKARTKRLRRRQRVESRLASTARKQAAQQFFREAHAALADERPLDNTRKSRRRGRRGRRRNRRAKKEAASKAGRPKEVIPELAITP